MIHLHVDLDTPHVLHRFYNGEKSNNVISDEYCQILLLRMAEFFSKHDVKATLFVITQDLMLTRYSSLLKELSSMGHEIASHSHTHPYLSENLEQHFEILKKEIRKSRQEIEKFFHISPLGFRAPSYLISMDVIKTLINEGYRYDGSYLKSIFSPALGFAAYLKGGANKSFGTQSSLKIDVKYGSGNFMMLPMPICCGFPIYNNFFLSVPDILKKLIFFLGATRQYSPYLFHLIEFVDYKEDKKYLSSAVCKHPNLKKPIKKRLNAMDEMVSFLKKQGDICLTRDRFQ